MQAKEIPLQQCTDLELDIIDKCNKLLENTEMTVKKVKKDRATKYCIMLDDYDILCNDDVIGVHKFCQNEKDVQTLAITAKSMVKNYKEKEAM